MDALKIVLFLVGTIALLTTVFLATKYPEVVGASGDGSDELVDQQQIRKLDKIATWSMWGCWGLTAALIYFGRIGLYE